MPSTPVVVLDSTLTDIANAIRSKTGGSATMTPSEMSAQIMSIGGGEDEPMFEINSTTGMFYTDMVAPLKKMLVNITPIQSGSGTPSPTNVRPISGHTSVSVTVSPTASPSDGTTYTTALGRTVYGGTLDVLSGALTVDRAMADLGTLTWGKASGSASNVRFYSLSLQSVIKKMPDNNTAGNIICSDYENTTANKGYSGKVHPAITEDRDGTISVYNEAYASVTASEFKTAMRGVQLCYELATPQTYQLTPQQINTLMGNNAVIVDGASAIEVVYLSHVLPTEYQAVEYIENTSTSYIDTGYSMTSDVTEQTVQFFSKPSDASSLFGAERSGAYTGVPWTTTGGVSPSAVFIGSTKNAITEAIQKGIWHTLTIKTTSDTDGSLTVDGYEQAFTYTGGVLKGYPIWLFNNNNASTAQYAKNRIARFQISDNGVKVRDLVACYRKADDVAGMYDIVNNVFYTNAGTGDFSVGSDV